MDKPKSPRGRDVRKMRKPWKTRQADFTFPDGWTMEIVDPDDFPLESYFMGHCLGRDSHYTNAVNAGTYRILSLREPDGTPHTTVVTESAGKIKTLLQVCGRGNKLPAQKYVDRIRLWSKEREYRGYCFAMSGHNEDQAYHDNGLLDDRWVGEGVNPFHGRPDLEARVTGIDPGTKEGEIP